MLVCVEVDGRDAFVFLGVGGVAPTGRPASELLYRNVAAADDGTTSCLVVLHLNSKVAEVATGGIHHTLTHIALTYGHWHRAARLMTENHAVVVGCGIWLSTGDLLLLKLYALRLDTI